MQSYSVFSPPCSIIPNVTQIENIFGTQPCVLFSKEEDMIFGTPIQSPAKKQKMSVPPQSPRKSTMKGPKPIPNLPILQNEEFFEVFELLGKGSFGTVYRFQFKSNIGLIDSPSFALKKVISGGPATPKDLAAEAKNYGEPGCIQGVGMTTLDGTYLGFSTIAEPLSKMMINQENIKKIINLTCEAIMKAPKSVIYDANLDNMGFIKKGTTTIVLSEDGFPCAGPLTEEDNVYVIDNGNIESPEDANPKYTALIPSEKMESEEDIMKFRKFKCDMMTALLQNQILEFSEDEFDIVAKICCKYDYQYASGESL
jgi:hypothetical protein